MDTGTNTAVGFRLTARDWQGWFAFVTIATGLLFSLAYQGGGGKLLTPGPEGYYPLITDSLLTGQLHLKVEPRSELMALSNPYDGALNQPYRLIDLSLYKGRYYFYWGLTPVVLFFAPIKCLTGFFPTEASACALFGVCALASMGWLVLAMRRSYFLGASSGITALALAVVLLGSLLPGLSMERGVYGVPIAAAAWGQAFLWCCIACALHSARSVLVWTLMAGVALSCSLGARPNYVLWSAVLIWPLAVLWRRQSERKWALVAAAILPPLIVILAMLTLNWVRFDQWTEFGMHYQLTGPVQPEVLFSWRNILPNFWVYGWNPPQLGRLFPFLTTVATGPFGVVSALPVIFASLGAWRLLSGGSRGLAVAGGLTLAGVGGFLATCAFFGCGDRYQIDYLPAMVSAGVIGALACFSSPRATGLMGKLFVGGLLVWSGVVAMLIQIQSWAAYDQERALPLARVFNRPIFWWDEMIGRRYGPVTLELKLPRDRIGQFEPVFATGDAVRGGELVLLSYPDDRHINVGFFQAGTTHWISAPLSADYDQTHRLEIHLGALNPPVSHPIFFGESKARRVQHEQQVAVLWDGRAVYRATLDFGLRRGERFSLGENRYWPGISAARFSGKIEKASQAEFALGEVVVEDQRQGPWRLKVRFPKDGKPSRYDPLLVSGVTGAGNFVNVFYPEPGKIAFSHDAWGFGGSVSSSISVDLNRDHVVEIDHGGLYPSRKDRPSGVAPVMDGRLRITLDGIVVLESADKTYAAPAESVTPGENRLGGSSTAARFSGEIISAERLSESAPH